MKRTWISLCVLALCLESASAQVRQQQWSSFRGERAAGVADGQGLPEKWDTAKGQNVKWKTPIPGLAHSSPIVWGNRVFVTTAISSKGGDSFRKGLVWRWRRIRRSFQPTVEAVRSRPRYGPHSLGSHRL